MAVPEKRELHGVPLERIPSDQEVRIFLSHKSADKPMVERYHRTLSTLGYSPWLDQPDMHAGQVLHRAIQEGLRSSCGAVFFVTEHFRDERWLRHEIDLAIQQNVERGERFRIITLCFGDDRLVPEPLRNYLFAKVEHDIDGLYEIVRALPLELGPPRWKQNVVR